MSVRKFMIVKPSPCCRDCSEIGHVHENIERTPYGKWVYCGICNCKIPTKNEKWVGYIYDGKQAYVEEKLVVWLPDDQENLDIHELLEVAA